MDVMAPAPAPEMMGPAPAMAPMGPCENIVDALSQMDGTMALVQIAGAVRFPCLALQLSLITLQRDVTARVSDVRRVSASVEDPCGPLSAHADGAPAWSKFRLVCKRSAVYAARLRVACALVPAYKRANADQNHKSKCLQVLPPASIDALSAMDANTTIFAPPQPMLLRLLGGYQNQLVSLVQVRARFNRVLHFALCVRRRAAARAHSQHHHRSR